MMKKRDSKWALRLLPKANEEKEQNGTNGKHQNDNPKESRKRKRSSEKSEAGVKKERQDEKTHWSHRLLGPMVQRLTGTPNETYQRWFLHHAILQAPLQPNVLHKENLFSYFEMTPPWTVHLPVPLYCTSVVLGETVPDLMVRFMLEKENYQRELKNVHRAYKRIESRHSLPGLDLRAIKEDATIQNSAAVVYAALLDQDPHPYLLPEYGYDYHFTGGSMATIGAPEGSGILATVFKAVGESLEKLEVIQLVPSKERDEIEPVQEAVPCTLTDTSGPILEITADIGGRWVLVRKRQTIIALREVRSAAPSLEETCSTSAGDTEWRAVQQVSSTVPFASVCIVKPNSLVKRTLTICTSDYRKRLRLWEIDGNGDVKRKGEHQVPTVKPFHKSMQSQEENNWSAVRCIDGRSLIGCLDHHRLFLYSMLTDGEKCEENDEPEPTEAVEDHYRVEFRGSSSMKRWTMSCERLCALEVAPAEGLIFIGTSHKLLIATVDNQDDFDLATHSRNSLRINVLLVFTHNLEQKPVFISHQLHWESAAQEDKTERHFLLFGSHLPMSYGICSFEKSLVDEPGLSIAPGQPRYRARHLPLHPPNFHDAYKVARARGFCLSADEPLRKRFIAACQSGMALIPTGKGEEGSLRILVQTSGGDLLQQKISTHSKAAENRRESDEFVRDRAEHKVVAETLCRWHEKLREANGNPKPYKVTDFRNLNRFRDIFNYPEGDTSELKDWFERSPSKKNRNRRAKVRKRASRPARSLSSDSDSSCSNSVTGANKRASQPWRQTIEELQQYKDVLAPAILTVWGYGTEGAAATAGTNTEPIPTKLPSQDVNERVGSWVATEVSNDRLPEEADGTNLDQLQEENPPDSQFTGAALEPGQAQATQANDPVPLQEENPPDSQFTGAALEPGQAQATQANDPVPLPKPNGTVYDDPELDILSQVTAVSASQVFQHPAERKAPTVARPARKKYVKGF